MTFHDTLHLLRRDVAFGGSYTPLEDDVTFLGDSHTYACDLLRRHFDVLALYFYVGGYFGGRLETYPPCIMDLLYFRGFLRNEVIGLSHIYRGWLPHL